MPKLRNVHPFGHVDVPLIGREGGPTEYYECQDDEGNALSVCPDPLNHEHALVKPDGAGPGQGCLVPGEEFEVSAEHAKVLLAQPDSFELVKTRTEKKG